MNEETLPVTAPAAASVAVPDAWQPLRAHTPARIALGRAGVSLPTQEHLRFQRDHARARDAVHAPLDVPALRAALLASGIAVQEVHSQAADRRTYLQRPDLGRRLREADGQRLRDGVRTGGVAPDIAIVIADGLSARAVMEQVPRFLPVLLAALEVKPAGETPATTAVRHDIGKLSNVGRTAAVCICEQGRVAVGDDIGEALGAQLVIVLIGERPGLSAADSLGLYLTWQPRRGRVDSERNCLSNIRPAGLDDANAARTCAWLVNAAFRLGYSGVELKDDTQVLEGQATVDIPFFPSA